MCVAISLQMLRAMNPGGFDHRPICFVLSSNWIITGIHHILSSTFQADEFSQVREDFCLCNDKIAGYYRLCVGDQLSYPELSGQFLSTVAV